MKIKYSFTSKALKSLMIITFNLLLFSNLSAQGWYDANWFYRRPVSVSNSGSGILTDYQVKITLPGSFDFGNTNANGSDIRVTTSDGTSEIPFWIETWNAGSGATIWAKVPSIPISGTTIYIYYGNPSAISLSDGHSTFRFYDDFETPNPSAGTGWSQKANLPTNIADQTAASYNGKIYSIGGYGNGPTDSKNKNYEYDPTADTWTEKAPMPTHRWGMIAVEFNGKIFVFGGSYGNWDTTNVYKNEVYDPATNTWDISKANIPAGLGGHGIMGLKYGNKIHLFRMGYHYEYDPLTDTYTQKSGLPTPRVWGTCATVNNKIYIIGGDKTTSTTRVNEAYDPSTDSWQTKSSIPLSALGFTRENPVINGKIYAAFGWNYYAFFSTNYCYDPATDIWEPKSDATHKRDGAGCSVVNNKLYVFGGRADVSGPFGLNYNEVYDPASDISPLALNSWAITGTGSVSTSIAAKCNGNYGMIIQQPDNVAVGQSARTVDGFGATYALDFNWNMTDAYNIGFERPTGAISLTETDLDGSLYFYNNSSNTPVIEWWRSGYTHLQNSSWNTWHKVTVIRNGTNSKVNFDNNSYSSLTSLTGGSGRITFGLFWAAKQYFDDIRVRKWEGFDPTTTLGNEQHLTPPAAPLLVSPANGALGVPSTPTFVWDASPTATSYHLQISTTSNFQFVFDVPGLTNTSIAIDGFVPGSTYFWRVSAINDRGQGNWSSIWHFTTCANPPTIYAGPDQTACSNATEIAMSGFAFTNASGASWSGGTGTWNGDTYSPSAEDVAAGYITLTYSTNTASPCGDVSDDMIVTFIPAPTVSWPVTLPAQCISSHSFALTGGSPLDGSYSGPGVTGTNFDASVAGEGTHTLTYTYTDPLTLCSASATANIFVNALTPVAAGSYSAVCVNAANISLAGSPSGGIWTGNGVSGDQLNGYVFHPSSGSQLLTYTYTDGNSCANTDQVTVNVNQLPVISTGSYGPVCAGASNINLIGSPTGGTWTGTGVSGDLGNGFVFSPSAGSQTLTYTYTDGNTCSNSGQVTVTVNNLPTVSTGAYGPFCENAADVNLTGSPAGGIWTGTGVSGNQLSGYMFDPSVGTQTLTYSYTDNNSCLNSQQVNIVVHPLANITPGTYGPFCVDAADVHLVGSPVGGTWTGNGVSGELLSGFVFDPSAGTQTLTYTVTDGNSCSNSGQTTIIVHQLPAVSAGSYGSACIDAADVNLAGTPAGGIWSGNGVSGSQLTGYVFDPSVGTQTLTYTITDVNSCSNSDITTITVNQLPEVVAGNYGPACINSSEIALAGTPGGGTWTGIGVSGNLQSGFVFSPSAGTQTLTYSYTGVNSCSNSNQTLVTVNQLPVVSAGTYAPVCINAAHINLAGTPAGGVWTGTGVSGNQLNGYVFAPSVGSQTLTYTFTDANSCSNSSQATITVHELPVVSAGTYGPACIESADIPLVGSPAGGIWTGTGVSGSVQTGFVFDPTAGTQTITYTYTDGNLCSNSAQTQVDVINLPSVVAGYYEPVCVNALDKDLLGTPAGGVWTGIGVSGNQQNGYVFDPSVGTQTLTYTYSLGNTCNTTDQTTIIVHELPLVSGGSYGPACIDGADIHLAGTPAGGAWHGTGVSGNEITGYVFDPSVGTQNLTYSYTDGNSCVNSDQVTINVNTLPLTSAGTYGPVCSNANDIALHGTPAGGVWSGTGVSGNQQQGFVFDPSVGTQTLTYSYTDGNTCVNSAQVSITVYNLPQVSAGSYGPACIDAADIALAGSPAGGTWTGTGVTGTQQAGFVFDPSAGTQTLTYSYSDGNSCANSSQVTITVHDLPVVTAGSYAAVCENSADVVLAGTPAGGVWTGNGVSGSQLSGYVFDPSVGTQSLTYSYTDGNTCASSDHVTINVNTIPSVNAGTYAAVCANAADIVLAGTPPGGLWSGTGVSGNQLNGFVFDPSVGTQTIHYAYTNLSGCVNSASVTITIYPLPTVSAGNYAAVPEGSGPITLTGTPAGGVFSGVGVSNSQFNPVVAGLGNHTITYTYQNENGCTNSATTDIIVYGGTKTLNLKLFLEGLYAGNETMDESHGLSGPQFGVGIADQVTIELHDSNLPFSTMYTYANVNLPVNGQLSISGIPGYVTGSYYIVVKNRNSVETWSSVPVVFGAISTISYDFSSSQSKAYGLNLRQEGTVWLIYAGDVNQDGIVDGSDMAEVDNLSTSIAHGYNPEDVNGDGIVDGSDMAIIDNNSTSIIQAKRP
ncbi:MAG: DUF2341 domain-containing protein [Bacteroidetes bacterium]|nr:DUF2341 domain-containing protein [Bacteroidota bacterium]